MLRLPPVRPGLGSLSGHRGKPRNVCTVMTTIVTRSWKVPGKVVAKVTVKGEEKLPNFKTWIFMCMA